MLPHRRRLIAKDVMHHSDSMPSSVGELHQFVFAHLSVRPECGQHHVQHVRAEAQHFAAGQKEFGQNGTNVTADGSADDEHCGVVDPNFGFHLGGGQRVDSVPLEGKNML